MAVRLSAEQIAVEYNPVFSMPYEKALEMKEFVLDPSGKFFPDETILGVVIKDSEKTLLEFLNEEVGVPEILPKRYIEAYNLFKKAKNTLSYSNVEDTIVSFVENKPVDKEKLKLALIRVFRFEKEHHGISSYLLSVINNGEENGRSIFSETDLNLKISPANTFYALSKNTIKSTAELYSLLKYTNWDWYGKKQAPFLAVVIFDKIDKNFPYLTILEKRKFLNLWKSIIETLESSSPLFFKRLKINLQYEQNYPLTFLFALSLFSRDKELRKLASDGLLSLIKGQYPIFSPQKEKFLKKMTEVVKTNKKKHPTTSP